MNINRFVADFGNSTAQFLIDGHYIEMPSSVREITKEQAHNAVLAGISKDLVLTNLIVRTVLDGKERFYKVGEMAKKDLLANEHIFQLHDKATSDIVPVLWLAAVAYHHLIKNPQCAKDKVYVKYFGTLLPIWLIKKSARFKDKLSQMERRFLKEAEVSIITGARSIKECTVKVEHSVCRIEGEVARYALKYTDKLQEREDARKYAQAFVIINDVGGQSQDMVKLQPGLNGATRADDFQSITDQGYLETLEKLRKEKLTAIFKDVRSVEKFIYERVEQRQFIFKHAVKGTKEDLTTVIEPVLKQFAQVAMEKAMQSFTDFESDVELYYIHIGGVCETLQSYMEEFLRESLDPEEVKRHIFPVASRKLNIVASDILAQNDLLKMGHDK